MTIVGGSDQRTQVANVGIGNFVNVVAVDSPTATSALPGSGFLIGPQHVLTAGHAISTGTSTTGVVANTRVTTSGNVAGLLTRANPVSPIQNASFNTTNYNFVDNYSGDRATDIALLTTGNLTTAANVLGLATFLSPDDVEGLPIATAGYPWSITQPALSINADPTGRTMYTANGTVRSAEDNGRFFYSDDVDTEGGQSGSGVWLDVSAIPATSSLSGLSQDLLLGVHTHGSGGSGNGGHLIDKSVYDNIVAQMLTDAGSLAAAQLSAAQLPENVIVGTDSTSFFFIPLASGNDFIQGSYRKELIIGQDGDDRLLGAGGDDRLDGGEGVDQALFSDLFTNYTFTITDPGNPAFEFEHSAGTMADGTDSTKDIEFGVFEFTDTNNDEVDDDGNVFFVPLLVDPDDNTKLKDGPTITPESEILDNDGNTIGTITVESPAWMFDGDVNYTLTLGAEQGVLFNFAYIIDVSGSVAGTPLEEAQNAYISLTESLIDQGIANDSRFAVIPFSTNSSLIQPADPAETITTISGLTATGFTNFAAPLSDAIQFFSSFSSAGVSNIAYFLSDGNPNTGGDFGGNAADLQALADVRAFGIGSVDINNLNIVDSGTAELLTDPSDLDDAFTAARVDKNTIERIDVNVAGTVVDSITPDQLSEDTLGLRFEGSIDGLEVTRTAQNDITFEVIFNDGTPTASLDYQITTGQEQVTQQTDDGTRVVTTFSVNQSDFTGTNESDEVIGNDLDNQIDGQGGNNILFGNGGDDRFIIGTGVNLVDGGDGIDTVVLDLSQAAAGDISATGNVINVGPDLTLINIEFIEFSDVRITTDTLAVTPILSLEDSSLAVDEGDTGSTQVAFTVNLSTSSPEDVVIDFATRSNNATVNQDFIETTGQLTIATGETSGEIILDVLGDTDVEGDETFFLDLTAGAGATFANNELTTSAGVNIVDDDSDISLAITADNTALLEGSPGPNNSLSQFSLDRFGGTNGTDIVEVEFFAAGDNPAQASDLVNGFETTQLTFAPGEQSKEISIPIVADQDIEPDETFGIRLTSISGNAAIASNETLFTIVDDDNGIPNDGATEGDDILTGTTTSDQLNGLGGNDRIIGLAGDDILEGGIGNDTVIGNMGNDTLQGGEGNDVIRGGAGDDILMGNTGKNRLVGGNGLDTLQGGSGEDLFVFIRPQQQTDQVIDFDPDQDLILLRKEGFELDLPNSGLPRSRFTIGSQAVDRNDRIIYSDQTGELFFDANGSREGQSFLIAQLDSGLNLSASNFRLK